MIPQDSFMIVAEVADTRYRIREEIPQQPQEAIFDIARADKRRKDD
jgi:hypothetical protein